MSISSRFVLLIAYLLLIVPPAMATQKNQLNMVSIFQDSNHTVYFSPKRISKTKNKYEVTVLLDFNSNVNHSGFEGNKPYMSSETRYVVDCKRKSIAFRGDKTYEKNMAGGKELDFHDKFLKLSNLYL